MSAACDNLASRNCTTGAQANVPLWAHLVLSVVSMVLLALAFPKPGWWLMIFLALVPMGWLALACTCARRLFWTTYLVSYVGWLVLMRWMIPVTFGGWWAMCLYLALHVPAALITFRLLVKYVHLPATVALPMAWVSFEWLRGHFPSGGFGWYVLGHALAPWQVSEREPMVAQLASIFGELGISFLVAMTSGWMVDALRSGQVAEWPSGRVKEECDRNIGEKNKSKDALTLTPPRRGFQLSRGERGRKNDSVAGEQSGQVAEWPSGRVQEKKKPKCNEVTWRCMLVCSILLLVSWGLTIGHGWRQWHEYMSTFYDWPRATVAVVQTNLPQYNKETPKPERLQEEWGQLLTMTRQAAASQGGDGSNPVLVMWTETIVPRPLDEESLRYLQGDAEGLPGSAFYHEQIAALSRELQVNLLVGTPWWKWERFTGEDGLGYVRPGGAYNAAMLYREGGQRDPVHYAKMHRVPFGEYVPWVEDWPWLKRMFIRYLTPYEFDYTLQPGNKEVVFEVRSGPRQVAEWREGQSGQVAEWPSGRVQEQEEHTSGTTEKKTDALTLTLYRGERGRKSGQVAKWPSGQVEEKDGGDSSIKVIPPSPDLVPQGDSVTLSRGERGDSLSEKSTLRFVTPICFEDAVPRVCRRLVYDVRGNKRADLIANITNDGWFAGTHQPWQHLQIATLRSIELGVPSARAVNTGISGFVNSNGRIEKLVTVNGQAQDVVGTATHTLWLNPHDTFFGRWGDLPIRIMVVLTFVMVLIGVGMKWSSGRKNEVVK